MSPFISKSPILLGFFYASTYLFLPLVFWHFPVSSTFQYEFFSPVYSGADITLRSPFKFQENQALTLRKQRTADTLTGGVSVLKGLEGRNSSWGGVQRTFQKAVLAGFTLWRAHQWVSGAGLGTTAAFGEPYAG